MDRPRTESAVESLECSGVILCIVNFACFLKKTFDGGCSRRLRVSQRRFRGRQLLVLDLPERNLCFWISALELHDPTVWDPAAARKTYFVFARLTENCAFPKNDIFRSRNFSQDNQSGSLEARHEVMYSASYNGWLRQSAFSTYSLHLHEPEIKRKHLSTC